MLLTHPTQFISVVLAVGLAVSFVYLWFTKLRIWEYLQVHADAWLERLTHKRTEFLNEFFSCIFKLGFWMSMAICIPLSCVTGDASYLLVPVCATPIVRRFA